jgi:hypothetical protein
MSPKELENIKKAIGKLVELPMFYFSLTSQEAFHSNFIKWLSRTEFGKLKLREIFEIPELETIERERNGKEIENRQLRGKKLTPKADLVGFNAEDNENPILVIENKVKDIPNLIQLQHLEDSFGKSVEKYIILSFIEPFFSEYLPFKHVSYTKFIDILKKDIDLEKKDDYPIELVKDYIKLSENIQILMDIYKPTGDYDFALNDNRNLFMELEKVNLWENYQRTSGSQFKERIISKIIKDSIINRPLIDSSINNQKATINFFYKWDKIEIGIQLENNQFRKYVYGNILEESAQRLIDNKIWFKKDFQLRRKRNGENSYRKYGSYDMKGGSWFLYQYEDDFYDDCKKNFQDMYALINKELAFLTIEENRKKIESAIIYKK